VDDLVSALILMMETDHEVTGPINLGNPSEFTIKQLAELVIKQCDSSSTLTLKALPSDDPKQRRPNIEKAKSLLGWEPSTPLEKGLVQTVEYFRSSLESGEM